MDRSSGPKLNPFSWNESRCHWTFSVKFFLVWNKVESGSGKLACTSTKRQGEKEAIALSVPLSLIWVCSPLLVSSESFVSARLINCLKWLNVDINMVLEQIPHSNKDTQKLSYWSVLETNCSSRCFFLFVYNRIAMKTVNEMTFVDMMPHNKKGLGFIPQPDRQKW